MDSAIQTPPPTPAPPAPAQPPTLAQRMAGFATALKQYTAGGGKLVTTLQEAERMVICTACEHFKDAGFMSTCSRCGCFSALKLKLPQQSCPINRWGPLPLEP